MADPVSDLTRAASNDTAWIQQSAPAVAPVQTPEQIAAAQVTANNLKTQVATENTPVLKQIAAGNTSAYYDIMAKAVNNPYDSRSALGAEIASRIYQNPLVTIDTTEGGSGTYGSLLNPYGYSSSAFMQFENTLAGQISDARAAVTPYQAELARQAQEAFTAGSAYNPYATITTNPGTFRGGAETAADIAAQVSGIGGTVDPMLAAKAAGISASQVLTPTPSPLTVMPTPTIQYASPLVATQMKEIGNTGVYSIVGSPSQVINQTITPSPSLSSMAIGNTGVYSLVGYQSQILGSNAITSAQQASRANQISPGVYSTGQISKIVTLPEYKSVEIAPGVYTTGVLFGLNKTPGEGLQEFTIDQNNPILAGLATAPLLAFGITAGKTISETESNVLTGIDALPFPSVLKEYGKLVTGFGAGATSMLVTTAPLAAAGTELALLHPRSFIQNIIPSVVSTGESTLKHAAEQPSAFFGELLGMYAGGKIATTAAGYSPVRVGVAEVPTGQTVFPAATSSFADRIFTGSPLVREAVAPYVSEFGSANKYAYLSTGFGEMKTPQVTFAFGSEVSPQVILGKSSLMDLMGTTHVEIPTEFAKYAPYEWTPAQREIITPFIERTAATPYESMLVTTARDLGRSEANLKYSPYQPVGTAPQENINFITSQKLQSVLGSAGEKSVVVGSRSQVDLWGEQFFRDVTKSDIDISASIMEQGTMFKGLREAYAGTEIQPRRSTLWDVTLEKNFKNPLEVSVSPEKELIVSEPEKRGFSFGVPGEEHTLGVHPLEYNVDVQGMPAINVAGTTTVIQTPENAILTKLSRVAGAGAKAETPAAFKYSPESGVTTVDLTGGKQISDLADIYAINRGIAKTAYSQGFYDLGKTFESRSEAIAGRLQSEGTDISSIVIGDILKGTPRSPQSIGAVLGVGIDIGKMPVSEEYPSTPMRTSTRPQETLYALSFAPIVGETMSKGSVYPSITTNVKQQSEYEYPASVNANAVSNYPYVTGYSYPSESKLISSTYPVVTPTPETRNNYPLMSVDITNNEKIQVVTDNDLMFFGTRIGKPSEVEYKKQDHEDKLLKKKRKQQPYFIFREVLPVITPIEEVGGFKQGKPFFRAIGNQQILKVTPEKQDWLHSVDVDVDVRELEQTERNTSDRTSNLSGMNFYRTATKQEKARTGKPILGYAPSQRELAMAEMVGFNTNKPKTNKARKMPWF